jgi:hypothetical protein
MKQAFTALAAHDPGAGEPQPVLVVATVPAGTPMLAMREDARPLDVTEDHLYVTDAERDRRLVFSPLQVVGMLKHLKENAPEPVRQAGLVDVNANLAEVELFGERYTLEPGQRLVAELEAVRPVFGVDWSSEPDTVAAVVMTPGGVVLETSRWVNAEPGERNNWLYQEATKLAQAGPSGREWERWERLGWHNAVRLANAGLGQPLPYQEVNSILSTVEKRLGIRERAEPDHIREATERGRRRRERAMYGTVGLAALEARLVEDLVYGFANNVGKTAAVNALVDSIRAAGGDVMVLVGGKVPSGGVISGWPAQLANLDLAPHYSVNTAGRVVREGYAERVRRTGTDPDLLQLLDSYWAAAWRVVVEQALACGFTPSGNRGPDPDQVFGWVKAVKTALDRVAAVANMLGLQERGVRDETPVDFLEWFSSTSLAQRASAWDRAVQRARELGANVGTGGATELGQLLAWMGELAEFRDAVAEEVPGTGARVKAVAERWGWEDGHTLSPIMYLESVQADLTRSGTQRTAAMRAADLVLSNIFPEPVPQGHKDLVTAARERFHRWVDKRYPAPRRG